MRPGSASFQVRSISTEKLITIRLTDPIRILKFSSINTS
jgi:hypothetical protein